MGVLSEEDYLKGVVDPEREEHPAKERIMDIILACALLRREGMGNETPNQLTHIIADVIQRR